jgi:hypothetical protein
MFPNALLGMTTVDGGSGGELPGAPGIVVTGRESYVSCRAADRAMVPVRCTMCGVTIM